MLICIWSASHGLCWLEKDVCVVTAAVLIFKLFFLEKVIVSVPLSPTCPLSPIWGCSIHSLGWGCRVCTSLFSYQQKYFREWAALCPLQTEKFTAQNCPGCHPAQPELLLISAVVTWALRVLISSLESALDPVLDDNASLTGSHAPRGQWNCPAG